MSLNFFSPIYLFGLLGISLPVLVHLLTRRQQTRMKFSAVYLLHQSQKRSIKRSRPNRLLLLLLRCLAIIFLSFALANPIFSFSGPEDLFSSTPSANVFILDDSYSMGAKAEDRTLYTRAVDTLSDLLKQMPSKSFSSLVLASTPGRVLQDWTGNPETLLNKLDRARPSYRTTSIGQGFAKALDLLESSPHSSKRIFLLTDLDKNGWNQEDFPEIQSRQGAYQVKVMDFSSLQTGVNAAAIKNVEITQEFLTNSRVIRAKAQVTQLSQEKPLKNFPVSLWIDGKERSKRTIDLSPSATVEREFSFPYLGNEPVSGYVRIPDDALMEDNRRAFIYQPDQKIKVLLVDGDPKTVSHQSETFYIEKALNPFSGSISDIEPTVSTLNELPRRDLASFSTIILCNARELPFDYERELEKFVLRGGALFITLGDQVDPKFYNEKLGNLLPVKIQALNQVNDRNEPFHLFLQPSAHPVLKVFDKKVLAEMNAIRFHSIYSIQPREDAEYSVPMTFSNKFPALIESEFGKGKVILFVSSVDRDWNNFPIQPTFVPWIQRWVKYSAHSLESINRKELLVGEPFIYSESLSDTMYIQAPKGEIIALDKDPSLGEIRYEETYIPGNYYLFHGPPPPVTPDSAAPKTKVQLPDESEKMGSFTINIDTRESDPAKISEEEIRAHLAGLQVEVTRDLQFQEHRPDSSGHALFTPFLLLVGLMLFGEGWLVRRE